jgi:hypothetical protein
MSTWVLYWDVYKAYSARLPSLLWLGSGVLCSSGCVGAREGGVLTDAVAVAKYREEFEGTAGFIMFGLCG